MRLTRITLFIALVAAVCNMLAAQTVTGTLNGRVLDQSGAVVPGAKVVVIDQDTGLTREGTSNAEGYFVITFLPIGRYNVITTATGFASVKKTGLTVELNKTTISEFKLPPATVSTEISVTGEAPTIDTTSGEIKDTLDAKTIEDRPLPTRNFLTLAETVPGFQPNAVSGQNNPTLSSGSSINFNGAGTRGATFQVNGVNNDDSSENQNRQGVNVSTIANVQVLRNNFSAEFGRSYGSVVLVQTKSGTNKHHGELFYFHINSEFTANEFFRNAAGRDALGRPIAPVPVQRRHDFGFAVGGPIKENKLFYFASMEQVKNGGFLGYNADILLPTERAPAASVTDPASRAWIQGIIDRFPAVTPNNPAAGPRAYTTTRKFSFPDWDYTGRTDWNISSKDTAFVRYQWSHQIRTADDIIRGERADQDNTQQNIGITWTHIYSPKQTGEFRVGVGRRATRVDIAAGNDTPIVRFSGTQNASIIGNAGGFPIHRFQTDLQYVYNHYWMASSRWSLRGGADVRLSQLNDLAENFNRGFWIFTTTGGFTQYQNFLRGFVTTFQKGYGPARLGNRIKEFNFYAQADWKARHDLTLNFGVRNESVRAPREVNELVDYGYDDRVWNLEPRIGFAWSPQSQGGVLGAITGGPGQFVVRGGYGIFHGRLFQSYFSQSGASIRFNPPNAAFLSFSNQLNVADPTNGFVFTPGPPTVRVGIALVDPNLRLPYTQQWNLTVERQLPGKVAVSASYLGNRGIGLPFFNIVNRAEFPTVYPNHPFIPAALRGQTVNCIDPNPANTNPAPNCISAAAPRINERRPDPRYSNVFDIRNGSWSYYHALQLSVNKRYSRGLSTQFNYTFGKALDTGSEATSTGIDTNLPVTKANPAASLRSHSLFDVRHRATLNFSYELPWYKSQAGFLGRMLGGWQISGTGIFATGNPFSVFSNYDMNADGVLNDRPDILDLSLLGVSVDNPRIDPTTNRQISQSQLPGTAFFPNAGITAVGSRPFRPGEAGIGNLPRNAFRAHGQNNWDAALQKNIMVREGMKFNLRWEVYNLANRTQFAYPNQTLTSALFGRISSVRNNRVDTQTGARYMQFAGRFIF